MDDGETGVPPSSSRVSSILRKRQTHTQAQSHKRSERTHGPSLFHRPCAAISGGVLVLDACLCSTLSDDVPVTVSSVKQFHRPFGWRQSSLRAVGQQLHLNVRGNFCMLRKPYRWHPFRWVCPIGPTSESVTRV